jgi:hypothetical protein
VYDRVAVGVMVNISALSGTAIHDGERTDLEKEACIVLLSGSA